MLTNIASSINSNLGGHGLDFGLTSIPLIDLVVGILIQTGGDGLRTYLGAYRFGQNVDEFNALVDNLMTVAQVSGYPMEDLPTRIADIGTLHLETGSLSLNTQLLGIHSQIGFDNILYYLENSADTVGTHYKDEFLARVGGFTLSGHSIMGNLTLTQMVVNELVQDITLVGIDVADIKTNLGASQDQETVFEMFDVISAQIGAAP